MTSQPHDTVALRERLDFIGLDDAARRRLQALSQVIEHSIAGALDAFYTRVRATPQTHAMFSNEQHLQGAKQRQERSQDQARMEQCVAARDQHSVDHAIQEVSLLGTVALHRLMLACRLAASSRVKSWHANRTLRPR